MDIFNVVIIGLLVLLVVLIIVVCIQLVKMQELFQMRHRTYTDFQDTDKEDFLRRLVQSSATTDINAAAFGVINLLLAQRDLNINYASLLIWLDSRKKMNYLGTNVERQYGARVLEHINDLHNQFTTAGIHAHQCVAEQGYLHYDTAQSRCIKFEYYIPLYRDTQLIGALYLESCDTDCRKVTSTEFFDLVRENITLVLYNIVLMQRVVQQANTDNLTKLYNRTYMMVYAESLRALKSSYSLILCDIDFFKSVNDTYGHQVGDIVLQTVAEILKGSVRNGQDGVFRYGGEEFLIIYRDAPPELVATRAEALRKQIQGIVIPLEDGRELRLTMSFGVYNADTNLSLEKNIARADKALYFSKENGRNRVTPYTDELKDLVLKKK